MKAEKPEGKRGAVYLRVSTDFQESASQREQVQRWLDKHTLAARWYVDDEGRNSRHKSEKREQFQRLMDDIALGLYDWVAVDAQDRIGFKHTFEFGSFIHHLLNHRCHLWSVTHGHLSDIYDPACQIMGSVGGVTSQREQHDKSERVIRGKISKFRQGTYPGGNVPYGLDVVILGPDKNEKWRVEYVGKNQRKKVYPDGRVERYDGEKNFPRYDATDTPYLAWSKDEIKKKIIQFIFSWYDREAIATAAIARWLNKQNILTQTGRCWQGIDVRTLLRNPIYKGVIAGGKEASGDFFRIKNGEMAKVDWQGNCIPRRENRPLEECIISTEYSLPGIIPEDQWARIQAKLGSPNRKPPRSESLWLKPFLFCGHCGKAMRGWHSKNSRSPACYVCATYVNNHLIPRERRGECPCRRHQVPHDLVEKLVTEYLEEISDKTAVLLQARQDEVDRQLEPWIKERERQSDKFWDTAKKMMSWCAANMPPEDMDRIGDEGLLNVFDLYSTRQREKLKAEIAEKEKDLDAKLDAFANLPKAARERASAKLEALANEINALKAEMEPLSEQAREAYNEMKRLATDLERARDALTGKTSRAKTEDLHRVIRKIIVYFKHTDRRGRRAGYELVKVVIEPVVETGLSQKTYDENADSIRTVGCSFATQKTRTCRWPILSTKSQR